MQAIPAGAAADSTKQPGRRGTAAQVGGLLVFLGASAVVAWLGTLPITSNVSGWYTTADKAAWSPPNGVFGPMWTALYAAMAIAAWLVWRRNTANTRQALTAYGVQLGLNLAWTPVFFGLHPILGTMALWLALAVILALTVAIAVTVVQFGPISSTAGMLLLPYLSWVVFSGSLNLWAAINN